MTALYLVGGALSAVMWLGLIYVIVVEPVRAHLRRRHGMPAGPQREAEVDERRRSADVVAT
jgi:hypothetical protein